MFFRSEAHPILLSRIYKNISFRRQHLGRVHMYSHDSHSTAHHAYSLSIILKLRIQIKSFKPNCIKLEGNSTTGKGTNEFALWIKVFVWRSQGGWAHNERKFVLSKQHLASFYHNLLMFKIDNKNFDRQKWTLSI